MQARDQRDVIESVTRINTRQCVHTLHLHLRLHQSLEVSAATMRPSTDIVREDSPLLHVDEGSNVVTFSHDDPEDPRNWSPLRKWLMVAAIIPIDLSVSWGASGYDGSVQKGIYD